MYKVREKFGVLSTPWGSWNEGEVFNTPIGLSPEEQKRFQAAFTEWKKKGIILTDDSGPDVAEIIEDTDILSGLNRQQLLVTIRDNGLNLLEGGLAIKPMKSWSEEAIRQSIRDVVPDLTALKIPGQIAEAVEA